MRHQISVGDRDIRRLQKIWSLYKRQGATTLRNYLIEHYSTLVRQHAERLRKRLPVVVEIDDLTQAGTLGLREAIASFDPSRHARFETFGGFRIRGAMIDELRSMDWKSRLVRQRSRQIQEATWRFMVRCGRTPSDEELAGEMSLPPERAAQLARESRVEMIAIGRESRGEANESQDRTVMSLVDKKAEDPWHVALRATVRELITRGLGRAERLIVTLYYYERLSMKEIGAVLDLSESRVSQMHDQILKRLRARLNPTDLIALK